MKKLFIFLLVISSTSLFAQDNLEALVKEGITLHDSGKYSQAIEKYEEALKIDSKSPLVLYEISYSYFALQDFKMAAKYSKKVIKLKDKYLNEAYMIYGSALDNMGEPKKAVKVYKEAIEKYPDDYLLYFNLGLTQYRMKDLSNAEGNFIQAIKLNSSHATSHLSLGAVNMEMGNKSKALLALYYFLTVEPNTERSKNAIQFIESVINQGVSKDGDKEISITLLSDNMESDFGVVDMFLSLKTATYLSEEEEKPEDLFLDLTKSFFEILEEQREGKSGFWWDAYVNVLMLFNNEEHLETYTHFIRQSSNSKSSKWLQENEDKVEAMFDSLKDE